MKCNGYPALNVFLGSGPFEKLYEGFTVAVCFTADNLKMIKTWRRSSVLSCFTAMAGKLN